VLNCAGKFNFRRIRKARSTNHTHREENLSVEQDIEKLEARVKQVENYVAKGVWEPERHEEMVESIVRAEDIFNRIISGYTEKTDMPPVMQAFQVSELQQRLHEVKHHLPSPPPKPVDKEKIAGKQVIIYTTPT